VFDMTVQLFKLQSGTYNVTGLINITDGCGVNPNDAANPTIGKSFTLTNDGNGNIGLGSVCTAPLAPGSGNATCDSAQPSNGVSCLSASMPAVCATASNPLPFNNNMGTLVRDNNIDDGAGCSEHRHVENLLQLTADNTFTASYTRSDTKHMGCSATADCTTTWTWNFVKQ
jgi:hypothetical protein